MTENLNRLSKKTSEHLIFLKELAKTAKTLQRKKLESLIHDIESIIAESSSYAEKTSGGDVSIKLLLQALGTIASGTSVQKVLQGAVEGAAKLVSANFGAVILKSEFLSGSSPLICFPKDCVEPFPYSKTIVEKTLSTQKTIFMTDILSDPDYAETRSIVSKKIVSVFSMPIICFGEAIGVVYLDSRESGRDFAEKDLPFLNDFASIISLAIESVSSREKRIEFLEKDSKETFNGLIGKGKAFSEILKLIEKYAPLNMPVLLIGETGTGKTLVAEAIHRNSGRRGPFIPVNCSNIPETIFESELFGYKKGAFTGAVIDKEGLVDAANDGTLFLDEIGELQIGIQSKLLQFLEKGYYRMLGDNQNLYKSNARIITATNRNLTDLVAQKQFRDDLYYRLNKLVIHLPPLRERTEDISDLCKYFTHRTCTDINKPLIGIEESVIDSLKKMSWKGNIRELESFIERLVIHADGPSISQNLLDDVWGIQSEKVDPYILLEGESEKSIVENIRKRALEKTGGNIKQAAELLDVSPSTLSKWLKREESGLDDVIN